LGHDDAFIGFVSQKIAYGWGFQQSECRSCSALSRLRASSTHAYGKLAIEAASVFYRARPEFSYNRTESDTPRVSIVWRWRAIARR
jgi:hypothetical protein